MLFRSNEFDPKHPEHPPIVVLQIGLALVPGPRIIARTVMSPGDADELFRAARESIEHQAINFGDAQPRRFDTTQISLEQS